MWRVQGNSENYNSPICYVPTSKSWVGFWRTSLCALVYGPKHSPVLTVLQLQIPRPLPGTPDCRSSKSKGMVRSSFGRRMLWCCKDEVCLDEEPSSNAGSSATFKDSFKAISVTQNQQFMQRLGSVIFHYKRHAGIIRFAEAKSKFHFFCSDVCHIRTFEKRKKWTCQQRQWCDCFLEVSFRGLLQSFVFSSKTQNALCWVAVSI